ncbi:MAG: EF-hand domain-containing protein [Verrucomicrobiaceae bacterium]|nr:MAG: EF-hand domain-containing protein [Verrucomicrobiaceae bacterium]
MDGWCAVLLPDSPPGKQRIHHPAVPAGSQSTNHYRTIMKTTCMMMASLACMSSFALAQPASQTGGGGKPGVDPQPGYDTNSDGKLSEDEQKAMMQEQMAMKKFREKVMLKKYDKDGDGKLSDDEKAVAEKTKAEAMEKHKAMKMAKWDTDKDGKLSDDEKKAMHQAKSADRKTILGKYDANKDGMLDDAELDAAGKGDAAGMDDMMHDDGQPQRKGSNGPSSSE